MSIHAKLIEFHKNFKGAKKTGLNPHYRSAYMTLEDLVTAVTPILNSLDLFAYHFVDGGDLVTVVADEEGDKVESRIPMTLNGNPQAAGSMVTYYKRYNLGMLLNVVTDIDDDGNAATEASQKPIDDKTIVRLRDELESLERDEAKFCQYIGVDSLESMTVGLLPKAERAIKQAHEALKK